MLDLQVRNMRKLKDLLIDDLAGAIYGQNILTSGSMESKVYQQALIANTLQVNMCQLLRWVETPPTLSVHLCKRNRKLNKHQTQTIHHRIWQNMTVNLFYWLATLLKHKHHPKSGWGFKFVLFKVDYENTKTFGETICVPIYFFFELSVWWRAIS